MLLRFLIGSLLGLGLGSLIGGDYYCYVPDHSPFGCAMAQAFLCIPAVPVAALSAIAIAAVADRIPGFRDLVADTPQGRRQQIIYGGALGASVGFGAWALLYWLSI